MNAQEARNKVRDAIDRVAQELSGEEYVEFLDLLMADAEGWKMTLEENEVDDA